MSRRNATKSWARCCGLHRAITSPVATFSGQRDRLSHAAGSCGSGVQGAQCPSAGSVAPVGAPGSGISRRLRTRRIVGRVHVQPDHITYLGHQLRIGRQLERLRDVGLQAERAPDAADHGVAHAGRLGHGAGAPVRLAFRRRLQGFDNDRLDRGVDTIRGAPTRGSSYNPSSRPAMNRRRHFATVVFVVRSRRTTALSGASAHASTSLARNATARLARARFVKRINSARSLSVSTTSALGRPSFTMPPLDHIASISPRDIVSIELGCCARGSCRCDARSC